MTQWRPLKSLSQKIERDADDINEIFIEADDSDESHSPSPNLAATSPEEQPPSQRIADTEATNVNVKHHEEDKNDDEFLNADVQAKKPRRKRKKKKHQGMCPLKPTPRLAKINKSLMMKILLRRKMILIPNQVRNLLDPAPRPQCHLFLARKQVKPTIQPLYSSQPVPAGASSLLQVQHRSSSGSYRQSRVRQANVNSRSSNRTDEAVSVPNVLYAKYHDSFPAETDFYSAQDNAVRFWHSPIT